MASQITPLRKKTEKTAASLVAYLRREAEELRKEKKRNTLSGIHKYVCMIMHVVFFYFKS